MTEAPYFSASLAVDGSCLRCGTDQGIACPLDSPNDALLRSLDKESET
jgi:hypothetical protein